MELEINRIPHVMLLDTGADISLIRHPVPGSPVLRTREVVKGITGDELALMGEQEVEVQFGSTRLRYAVTVADIDIECDGLLGRDLSKELSICVDLRSGRVTARNNETVRSLLLEREEAQPLGETIGERQRRWIQDMTQRTAELARKYHQVRNAAKRRSGSREQQEIADVRQNSLLSKECRDEDRKARRRPAGPDGPPSSVGEAPRGPYPVRTRRAETLPAYSERLLRARVSRGAEGQVLLVEPEGNGVQGVRGARTLSACQGGNVWVKVLNATGTAVKLDKHQVLGAATVVSDDEVQEQLPGNVRHESSPSREEIAEKLSHLPDEERLRLEKVIWEYRDVFGEPGPEGCSLPVQHRIETGEAAPVAKRPYRVPYHERPIVREKLDEMLEKGVIEPSDSPWAAPVVLVRKRMADGEIKYRFCTDFRGLNAVTKADAYPLPLIQETLDQLGASQYFSTLDLSSGYWQIPIAPEHQEKTAFTTAEGHFEYKKMAFGLSGAPATFQRTMDRLLGRLKGRGCLVYLDDTVIYSDDAEQHAQLLREVFELLRSANLKANWQKCKFAVDEVTYLGHVVTKDGVKPDPAKVEAVKSFPMPTKIEELQSFLGLANYYRRFIPDFATIAKPLTVLTSPKVPFQWKEAEQQAFNKLKDALCSDMVLIYPDFRDPFILSTDASGVAIGAVLSQIRDGEERPISYASRQLKAAERNYSVTERELLGVVWATKVFRCYLLGRRFTLITDHGALRWMLKVQDSSARLTRWSLRLAEFDYVVEHRAGKKHLNADALSRRVAWSRKEHRGVSKTDLRRGQEEDDWCQKLAQSDRRVRWDSERVMYWAPEGMEETSWKAIVPPSLRSRIIDACHSPPWAGHPGVERTTAVVGASYYWPSLRRDVKAFVKGCETCALRKTPAGLRAPLERPFMATRPFEQVSLDIVGPLPKTKKGFRYLLTMIDNFTRYAEAYPLREQTAEETAKAFVEGIVTRHGVPQRVLTDQGRNFVSNLFKETCRQLGIQKLQTTAYHPEGNGMVERLHRTLTDSIAHFVRKDGRDWDRWIPYAVMAYRSIPHSSTGYSPNFLVYGREVDAPGHCRASVTNAEPTTVEHFRERLAEAYQAARERAEKAWAERTAYCNRKRKLRAFRPGDWVYLHVPAIKVGHCPKFHCPWTGPHEVLQALSRVTYRVRLRTGEEVVVHVNRLKEALGPGDPEVRQGEAPVTTGTAEVPDSQDTTIEAEGILPGLPYMDETSDDETEEPTHAGCPVIAGTSSECSFPSCPLGGTFGQDPRGSLPGAEQPDEEADEEDSSLLEDTVVHREAAHSTPCGTRGPGGLRGEAGQAGTPSETGEVSARAREEGPVVDDRLGETESSASEVSAGSEWTPHPRKIETRERSPYNLRERKGNR